MQADSLEVNAVVRNVDVVGMLGLLAFVRCRLKALNSEGG